MVDKAANRDERDIKFWVTIRTIHAMAENRADAEARYGAAIRKALKELGILGSPDIDVEEEEDEG